MRDHSAARRGRHGRSLARTRHAPRPRRRGQGAARRGGAWSPLGVIVFAPRIVDRFDAATNSSDLWRVDLGGGTSARLTFSARGTMEDTALFSPDGERVALTELDTGGVTRSRIQPTGGGTKQGLLPDSDRDFTYLTDWSRDGKTLLISPQRMETGQDVEVLHLDGDRKPVPLVRGPSSERDGRFPRTANGLPTNRTRREDTRCT